MPGDLRWQSLDFRHVFGVETVARSRAQVKGTISAWVLKQFVWQSSTNATAASDTSTPMLLTHHPVLAIMVEPMHAWFLPMDAGKELRAQRQALCQERGHGKRSLALQVSRYRKVALHVLAVQI